MVIGDSELMAPPQQMAQPASIDNIMSGISNTGTVKMNNHRKKLRQRWVVLKYKKFIDISQRCDLTNPSEKCFLKIRESLLKNLIRWMRPSYKRI